MGHILKAFIQKYLKVERMVSSIIDNNSLMIKSSSWSDHLKHQSQTRSGWRWWIDLVSVEYLSKARPLSPTHRLHSENAQWRKAKVRPQWKRTDYTLENAQWRKARPLSHENRPTAAPVTRSNRAFLTLIIQKMRRKTMSKWRIRLPLYRDMGNCVLQDFEVATMAVHFQVGSHRPLLGG